MLLFLTGSYGFWAVTKGNLWHHRQFVSASWGFILMFLCWSIVYIAVEKNHVEKVNNGCLDRNKDWTYQQCDDRRKTATLSAIILVTIGSLLSIYFTLVVSRWISRLEWEEHLENERRLEQWRSGHGENPHIKRQFQIQGAGEKEEV
ncbi:hypothetical protein BGW38_007555 [Lunasporangiospora selenospora]|uniref:Uncharacterized protein n=1 Tax=Lunasporangiospora selenospora TaxID=979761 RepID=A0A9P6G3C2_9FUNG|nr:hypothetical protein BGW38_007555 [Lunasporangiospora selenospora]